MFNNNVIEKLKIWIDGDTEDLCTQIQRTEEPRKSEEFMKKVAMSLDTVLQDEIFIIPNKEAQVPLKFVVYLNPTDDLLWQSTKRAALEQSLSELIYSRAVELAQNSELSTNSIEVKLKCDKSLAHPMFQVVAFWSDSEVRNIAQELVEKTSDETTVVDATLFMPSTFKVRVWKNAMFQNEFSIYKNYAVIGRKFSKSVVDISINEPFVSRIQAKITFEGNNKFFLTNEGVNPIAVNKQIIPTQMSAIFHSMETVVFGNYLLKFFVDENNFTPIPPVIPDIYATRKN